MKSNETRTCNDSFLGVSDIHFAYKKDQEVLHGLTFNAYAGELCIIAGPNGCGKSTLLQCMVNVFTSYTGSIYIKGVNTRIMPLNTISQYIGYVPQECINRLGICVADFVLLGLRHSLQWRLRHSDIEIVFKALQRMNLDKLAMQRFDALSGGQRQKVLIARALVQNPECLIFDEPISSLDIKNQLEIMNLAYKLAHEENKCVLMTVHDITMARHFADKIILLNDGKLVQEGHPHKVLSPEFIEAVYGVSVSITPEELINPFKN